MLEPSGNSYMQNNDNATVYLHFNTDDANNIILGVKTCVASNGRVDNKTSKDKGKQS
jgi:hypothetical protein